MINLSLRAATEKDRDFLYELHRATMKAYVVQTWGTWDEEWQQHHFGQHLDLAACHVIVSHGQDVGVVCVLDQQTEMFLSVLEVLPQYQGRGIGTSVIRSVLTDAHRRGKPLALQVLKVNPARRLYERLGFITAGETETHYLLRASPRDTA